MWCFGKKPSIHHCKIVLLDETEFIQEFQDTSDGQQLLEIVFKHLNLMETAYFGLRYLDTIGQRHWLDPNKKIIKQMKGLETFTFYFGVKFYAADPCKLLEEITRYQFFLQVKQDIYQGRLPLTFDLATELFAYAIQSELGDYDPRRHQLGYPSEFRFTAIQTSDLEAKAAEIHKTLSGRVPAVAELNFLDRVKWLDMYGVDLHPVLGEDSVEYFLGLTPSGILVLRNKTRVGNYFWPRITKVYYKRKYFMVRVRDKNSDENTYGFELPNKQACKHLWRCCSDHRQFFRLTQVREVPGQSSKVLGLENKLVYSGRPQKNIQISGMQARLRTPPTFVRVPSRRYQKRLGQPDGADASGTQPKEELTNTNGSVCNGESRISSLSPATPSAVAPSLHRSTSVPTVVPGDPYKAAAPWEDPARSSRGLYSSGANPSPRSVRSAGAAPSWRHQRAGSIDSAASYDYRKRKHHHHHHSRQSDNESEVSKSSRCSKSSRSSRHRRHGSQSGDGSDSDTQHRHRRHCRRKKHGSSYELVNSENQWREVQKQSEEQSHVKMQSAVVKDLSKRRSGYMNSGLETESEANYSHRRRHRRRSRSRSPESKGPLSTEVKRYIDYNLIDPSLMTEDEKRDIKYTKVQTDSRFFKIRYSPPSGRTDAVDQENNNSGTHQRSKDSQGHDNTSYTQFTRNGHTQTEHHPNDDKGSKRSGQLIPKPTLNGFAHSISRSSNNVSFVSDVPVNSNAAFITDWTQTNRNMTTFDKKLPTNNGEKHMMNGNVCRPHNDVGHLNARNDRVPVDNVLKEKISGNVRIMNGHYYPAPKPPPPPRVTFLNEVSYQQYPPKILGRQHSSKAKE